MKNQDWDLFCEFEKLLEERYIDYSYSDSFYTKLGLSQKRLNTIAKTFTGKTACQLVNEKIILEAKKILIHQRIKIKDLAWSLGYEDEYYFSRVFKKVEGVSPKKYKQNFTLSK